MGKHKLENLLTEMCKTAGLAHIYTPHCIRATSVTVLKAAGLENRRIKSVTGHASDKSIESYSARPTIDQQFESSAIVSRFLTKQNPDQVPSLAAVSPQAISSLAVTSSTAIQQRNQQVYQQSTFNVNPSSAPDFTYSVFHGCNFFFNPRSDNWNDFILPETETHFLLVRFLNSKLWTKSAEFSSFWSQGRYESKTYMTAC